MSVGPEREDLSDLEAQLRQLRPAATAVDARAVLFRAGQRSYRRRLWQWSGLTGVLGLALGLLTAYPLLRWTVPPVERVVVVRVEVPAPPAVTPAPESPAVAPEPSPARERPPRDFARTDPFWLEPGNGYLSLRDQVVRWGIDVLPSVPVPPGGTEKTPTLLQLYTRLAEKGRAF